MSANDESLNVLISAFSCAPDVGSEFAVGWHWANRAARHHRVWVLLYPDVHRDAIEQKLREQPDINLSVIYWEVPLWPKWIKPEGWTWTLYYLLWELTVPFMAMRMHRKIRFDIIHRLTIITIDIPGFLWLLDPAFVWGPVGGGHQPPRRLREYFGSAWYWEIFRTLRKRVVPLNPLVRLAVRRSRVILAANSDTERLLRKCGATAVQRELETAIELSSVPDRIPPSHDSESLRVLWAGNIEPWKGASLAIDAIAEARRRGVQLEVQFAGDGSMSAEIDDRIQRLRLQDAVHRLGRIPHSQMSDLYLESDVFLFTSLRDTTGTVILEAMAHGLPVIALDHHGAKDVITEECGFKVAIGSVSETINGLADALERAYREPRTRKNMGNKARTRIENFYSWERKGEIIPELYSRALKGNQHVNE